MTDLILHQYPGSPFSEKIRNLFGYKQQAYQSVEIPVIMPKPDLMALTGGYRKTPVLQHGADIYCDTGIICQLIDRLYPQNPIYPQDQIAQLTAAAHWTDTFLFKASVAVAFQPKALEGNDLFSDPAAAEAFMKDRADFSKGSTELGMDLNVALPHWLQHMTRLEQQLSLADFLGGSSPTILDFSTYHCCWFVYKNDALKGDLAQLPALGHWMERMAAFGHGQPTSITGDAAVTIAKNSSPEAIAANGGLASEPFDPGAQVEVVAIDYGFQPTQGELVLASGDELVVKRIDERAGEVNVHFPRLGFRVNPVQ
jgi:glutathione S-transferase